MLTAWILPSFSWKNRTLTIVRNDWNTGFPRLSTALSDIALLGKKRQDNFIGVLVCSVHPDPAFIRLSPESARRLWHEIANRLGGFLRPGDRLYESGNWEWLIVFPDLRSSATLSMGMIRIDEILCQAALFIDGIELHPRVSCGASVFPDDGDDALHVVQSARIASLHAEGNGTRNALYDPQMEVLDHRLKDFGRELKSAFSGDDTLQLFLQPQVDAKTRQCVGAEALVRWRRQNGEWVPPVDLIAAIEQLGFRQNFSRWLFLNAARTCDRLMQEGMNLRLSINVSAHDLLDREVPDMLAQALETWSVSPGQLRMEVTETSMVEQSEEVANVVKRLRQLGITFSIDDFGTGFSGMSHLKHLPVDEVKIDQSFVVNMLNSRRDREITESIIRLAHRLKHGVVAEGVEDLETANLLTQLECNWLQGYFFSRPLPLDEFCAWYRQREDVPDETHLAR